MKLIQRYPALRRASLKSLQAFESAYLHRSFATAAQELSVTASAISHSILSLESVLGVHLFNRGRKGAIPTDAGTQLYSVLKRSFVEIDMEMQSIVDRPSVQQLVTLQSPPSFAHLWILPRLPEFMNRYPQIDLRLWAVHEPANFGNNGLDIAVVYGKRPNTPLVASEPLMPSESYVPMCSPFLAAEKSLQPSDMSQMFLIHCETSIISWNDWVSAYYPEGTSIQRGLYLDRSFMSLSAASDGLGVCLDSTLLAHDRLRTGQLVMPFGNLGISATPHYLCVPKQKQKQEKVQIVVQWIKSWLPDQPGDGK